MTTPTYKDPDWYQMVLVDEKGLSGPSVTRFVSSVVRLLGASAVVISDLIGAVPSLKDFEGTVLSPDDFLRKSADATQFDWAFLFLYASTPEPGEAEATDPKKAMLKADLTVRLADDTYFYVYGRDQRLMTDLKRDYPGAEMRISKFADLDIPY